MSDMGFGGYIGIVAGLVLMLAVCLFYIVFSYSTDETSTKGQAGSHEKGPEEPTSDTKHAA
jgi:hypothetical protein